METLAQKNIELAKILFSLKQSIDTEKLLGLNADSINSTGIGKKFFVHIQMVLIESCVINICKIFEQEKKYPLNSIYAILSFVKTNNINPKYPDPIDEFIKKYGDENKEGNHIEILETICRNFYSKHQVSFERYDYARDKVIAHSEHRAQRKSLPSHAVMKDLLHFGIEFYYMINKAFLNIGPHPIHGDKQAFSSLYRLLEKLGYKNIKKDFDN